VAASPTPGGDRRDTLTGMPPLQQTPNFESVAEVDRLRRLFWQNVVREWLTALPRLSSERPELLDGRLSVLTEAGERIPLKSVHPVFACSIPGAAGADLDLSLNVQCTVFEIHSTTGEVFTLPIHEIRGLHALSEELVTQLEAAIEKQRAARAARNEEDIPFGFAAFNALSRQRRRAVAEDGGKATSEHNESR